MKKMISKRISLLLIAAMVFTMVPAESIFAEEIEAPVESEETVISEDVIAEESEIEVPDVEVIAEEAAEEVLEEAAEVTEEAVAEAIEVAEETETEEAEPGDSSQNPKELIAGQKVTLSDYSGSYYMKFTAPENMILDITLSDKVSYSVGVEYSSGAAFVTEPVHNSYGYIASLKELKMKIGQVVYLEIMPNDSGALNTTILADYSGQSYQRNYLLDNVETGVEISHSYYRDVYIEAYRRESTSQPWTYLGRTTSSSEEFDKFVDKKVVSGKLYAYTCRQFDKKGYDEEGIRYYYASKDEKGKGQKYLSFPKLTVTNTAAGVVLKWEKVEGAKYYMVTREAEHDEWYDCDTGTIYLDESETLANVYNPTTTYTDKTAVAGIRYTYCVYATEGNSFSRSATSWKYNIFLSSITPTISNVAAGIYVKWPAVKGATGYRVYRKYGTGAYKLLTTTTATTYGDKAVNTYNGYAYTYAVRAIKTDDSGTYAGAFTPKTLVRLTKVTLAGASRTKAVYLKWTKNAKATGYQIQYSTASNFTGGKIAVAKGASTLTKTIGSLYSNKTYYIRIRAYKTVSGVNHYGAWSNTVAVKTK